VVGIIFGTSFGLPQNAYATCVNTIQAQTIANAYNGDVTPTVHHMDTCSGDDVSYRIPIATTITFDGRQYEDIYATTNSVITFGQPDGTFHTYPSTPSISLYSMDWFPGASGTSGLDIYYSEGGFQLNLNMVPFGNYGAQPSTVNILVAITNTGGISVAYSYQGPQYQNLRTGVRLHNGSIVSLEAWGATQVSPSAVPTLQADPVSTPVVAPTNQPTPTPTPTPMTPEEQQAEVVEAVQLAAEISDLNNLIAAINGEEPVEEVEPEPSPEPSPDVTEEPDLPEPDVEVEPEIITPEDPRFPDDEEQTEPDNPNPSPSSDTTDEENTEPTPEPDPSPEPSQEPSPQPEDTDPVQEPEQESPADEEVVSPPSDNNNIGNAISEEELNKLNKLIAQNDAKLLAQLTDSQKEEVAEVLGIQAEEILVIAELAQSSPAVAEALASFAEKLEENKDSLAPYTLADAITEENVEMLLENPIGALTNIDLDTVLNPSEWGKDMTDDQREKLQEVVIPVIIASNIIAASMTRRIG
jgi:hypothetical protein